MHWCSSKHPHHSLGRTSEQWGTVIPSRSSWIHHLSSPDRWALFCCGSNEAGGHEWQVPATRLPSVGCSSRDCWEMGSNRHSSGPFPLSSCSSVCPPPFLYVGDLMGPLPLKQLALFPSAYPCSGLFWLKVLPWSFRMKLCFSCHLDCCGCCSSIWVHCPLSCSRLHLRELLDTSSGSLSSMGLQLLSCGLAHCLYNRASIGISYWS